MNTIKCPYCGSTIRLYEDFTEQDVKHQMDCMFCDKRFYFLTTVTVSYTPHRAACLNGEEHKYQLSRTHPKEMSRMRCTVCDESRKPTDEERKMYDIGTFESYLEMLKKLAF